MNDKTIVKQMLERYINNIIYSINIPIVNTFSSPICKYIMNYIDPYIDLFCENDEFEIEAASAFVKNEAIEKIKNFKNTFKEIKQNENNQNI